MIEAASVYGVAFFPGQICHPRLRWRDRLSGYSEEREFIRALCPAYFEQLRSERFVTHSIDDLIELRLECRDASQQVPSVEPLAARGDWSDVPIVCSSCRSSARAIESSAWSLGWEFFKALAERLTEA